MIPRPEPVTPPGNLAELGAEFLKNWRRKFKPVGLHRVAALARAAESETAVNSLTAQEAEMNATLAKMLPSDRDRGSLEATLKTVRLRISYESSQSMAASRREFSKPENVRLLHDDLQRMVAALEVELARIEKAQTDFNKSQGFGASSAAEVELSNPAHAALSEFRRRHVEPAVGQMESAMRHGVSFGFDPAAASWVLVGCDWHDVLPKA